MAGTTNKPTSKKSATKASAKTAPPKKVAAEKAPAKKVAAKPSGAGFSAEERAAMKERAAEVRAAKRGATKADGEAEVLAKLAEMPSADRELGERVHSLVMAAAPDLVPRLWYGMPAYAKDGKVLCFFQGAQKFKTRYSNLGFSDEANLDDGTFWPSAYAITALTRDVEKRITALVKRAVSA